jgi:hypothetical protein
VDAIVVPLLSGEDSPQTALRQMRLADVRAVSVEEAKGIRLVFNREVLLARGAGVDRLAEVGGPELVSLESIAEPVWRTLGPAAGILPMAVRHLSPPAAWDEVEARVQDILAASGAARGMLRVQGSTVLIVTGSESDALPIRAPQRQCACEHEPKRVLAENPPRVADGQPCDHGGGKWECY